MKITYILNNQTTQVEGEEGRSLLDIALIAGLHPSYSCMQGHCHSCSAFVNGEYTQTCQALPSSDTIVDYDKSPSR